MNDHERRIMEEVSRRAMQVRRDLALRVRRAADELRGDKEPVPAETAPQSPPTDTIAYIGLAGYDNLGDDAMFAAVRQLMPWANLEINPTSARAVLLGGGTLFNAGRYYLNRLNRVQPDGLPGAVFGTGFRSPDFWGTTEDFAKWQPFLRAASFVGVRGPDSARWLEAFGYDGAIEIIGDPALSLTISRKEPIEGHVVVAPLHTGGELLGGDDAAALAAIVSLVRRLRADDHPVTLMSSHPNDDRWVLETIRAVGDLGIDYVAGYADLTTALRVIASAELVVGERLHASILAAAMGTPFVAVAYRPKVIDFARSVAQGDAVVPTDDTGRLPAVFDMVWAERERRTAAVGEHVIRYRSLQADAAERFRSALET